MAWTIQLGKTGPAVRRNVTCASCGQAFGCELALGGCWCREIPLTDEVRARLRAAFSDCLCRECLTKYSAGAPIEGPGSG